MHAQVDQPGVSPECSVIRWHRAPSEAERGDEETAALVEHGLLDHLIRPLQQRLRNRQAERLRGLEVDD
jgi:hypothetical protein